MSPRTVVGLYLPADPASLVQVVTLEPTLAGCRQYVGLRGLASYLEAVDLGGGTHMYVDEDGRVNGLVHNPRASALARGLVLGGDDIVGDALVLGTNDEGDEASLTVGVLAVLANRLGLILNDEGSVS